MKRLSLFAIIIFLLAVALIPSANAAPAKTEKERLVLMPLKTEAVDKSMHGAMETAIVEGLEERYTVFSGENVAKKAREIFMRETREAVKKDCDETRCLQDIAGSFQAELIAVASVTKRSDGFFIALSIRNIMDEKTVYSKSLPCEGCNEYQVVSMLKTLAGGNSGESSAPRAKATQSSPSSPASPAVPSGDFSLDDLDSQAKAEEGRKATEKAKWDKYLSEMKKAFGQVEGYERRDISKELKVSAWEKFLTSYKNDDPYSTEDKDMREKAKGRIERIKAGGKEVEGMAFVKGGCYEMGDTFDGGSDNEKPVHNVCLDDFYMGKYPVTQRQWMEFMGSNPSHFKGCDDCPVESVSWDDAQEYITKLNEKTGQNYRLPTEAEWEYAARSGGKNEKYAGTSNESELGNYAWYSDNSGNKIHPVGQKRPNGLGLYDMSGNVWQWVSDWYDGNYYKNSPKDSPQGPSDGSSRVNRGGGWEMAPRGVRTANRGGSSTDRRYFRLGFRLVRTE